MEVIEGSVTSLDYRPGVESARDWPPLGFGGEDRDCKRAANEPQNTERHGRKRSVTIASLASACFEMLFNAS